MQKSSYECLPTVNIGGNDIRYVGVDISTGNVVFPKNVNSCPGRLLFLGVDVMSGTNGLCKNYGRSHIRFSKLGLATKLELEGFKIDGVHNSSSMWFYSIQGLFRVAFELGNIDYQKDCLILLKDEWLKRYKDPELEQSGVLKYVQQNPTPSTLHGEPLAGQHEQVVKNKEALIQMDQVKYFVCRGANNSNSMSIINSANKQIFVPAIEHVGVENTIIDVAKTSNLVQESIQQLQESVASNACEISVQENLEATGSGINEIKEDLTIEDCELEVSTEVSNANTSSISIDDPDAPSWQYRLKFEGREIFDKLSWLLKEVDFQFVSSENVKRVTFVLDYLNYFEEKHRNSEQNGSVGKEDCYVDVLFRFMEDFLFFKSDIFMDTYTPKFEKSFNISNDQVILLNFISEWLGEEFHKLETAIARQVDKFKQENITSIDDLPSSEALIDTLFPPFMKIFITSWCGFSKTSYLTQKVNKDTESRNTNFPLVQLMLEFGSNSLISGIAHVVFSRLQVQSKSETDGKNDKQS